MKLLTILACCSVLLCGCGGTAQNNPSTKPPNTSTPTESISPIPDDIGLVLQCNKCVFAAEGENRSIAGQVHNGAKQAITGYVMAVDLQDARGTSVRKIPGLMLMQAMMLQPGETKEFKERVLSNEANVTQATVYFKKAGKEVKLSNTLTLKLNAPAAPTSSKKIVQPKR